MLDFLLAKAGIRQPFEFVGIPRPDDGVSALFEHSFRAAPPDYPHHFIARHRATGAVAGYIHFTEDSPGVYLCGGLCVDARIYRRCSARDRRLLADKGSLSRWLLNESIALLPAKRAVFAYTGNPSSLRDGLSSGFVETAHPHLIVQWHAATSIEQPGLIESMARKVPF
jgi:hypothetical protein